MSLESFPGLPFSDAGYSGINAANRLDLLSNDELRRRLVSYYELDQPDLREYHGIVYDRREALFESMYPYVEHTSFPDDQGVLRVTLRRPWEDLTSDPVVMGRLSRYGASVGALAHDLESLQGQLAEIRTLVGEHLRN
jgi:hypothetical protein